VSEKVASKSRHRRPNTVTIIKAAKAAGAASVTFPDGTFVTLAPAQAPSPNKAMDVAPLGVDEWGDARPM
jgi:hypothetical protein